MRRIADHSGADRGRQINMGASVLVLTAVLAVGPAWSQEDGSRPIDRIEDPVSRTLIGAYTGVGEAYNATVSTLFDAGALAYSAASWSALRLSEALGVTPTDPVERPLVTPEMEKAIEFQTRRILEQKTPPLPTPYGRAISSASLVGTPPAFGTAPDRSDTDQPSRRDAAPATQSSIAADVTLTDDACSFDGGKVDGSAFDQVKKMVGALKTITDSPRQMPDGTLFVPKTTQRLMMIRTALPCSGEAQVGERLAGRITVDRIKTGIVQSSQTGRLEPAGNVFPFIGMPVTQGQTIALLRPVLPVTTLADIATQVAQLEGEITKTELSLLRLREFPVVPFRAGRILSLRLQLDTLRKQRDAVLSATNRVEELRASATGIISATNGEIGEVVTQDMVLWEIVEPNNLWVEAVAYSGLQIDNVTDAHAVTADGRSYKLNYVGRGRRLEKQAIPLQFRIAVSDDTLVVDQPVTVYLRTGQRTEGLVIPSDAVVRGPNGRQIVFAHVTPERFEPRQVSAEPLDGETVLVVSGLDSTERLVTAGAHVLNQVR